MNTDRLLSGPIYGIMWLAIAAVYIIGLFVPIYDADPAHHALIALHMLETDDFISLIDRGKDYLDKPHLLFWLSALSFKIFGVTTFAYKFPSLLASILGFYATYRLGKLLYSENVGKLAALIYATCFAQFLANQDVRMDAMLTAYIVFSVWMLMAFIRTQQIAFALGAAFGMALGFSTKGGIGVAMPLMAAVIQLLFERNWKALFQWKWLVVGVAFVLFISPVLYAYYQQFDLHPEKVIRGMTDISGIKFILLGQSVERFQGEAWGGTGSNDPFFFLHTLLWAGLPWSFLNYWSLFRSLIRYKHLREALTPGIIVIMMVIMSLAQYKLPHYLNLIFPYLALQLSGQLFELSSKEIRWVFYFQCLIIVLMLGMVTYINTYYFPIPGLVNQLVAATVAGVILFLSLRQSPLFLRLVTVCVAGASICFMALNANGYPQLFNYDSGYQFAQSTRKEPAILDSFDFYNIYSYTFDFYTQQIHPPLPEGQIPASRWILTDAEGLAQLRKAGIKIAQIRTNQHYHLSRFSGKFLDPKTRFQVCERRYLIERY